MSLIEEAVIFILDISDVISIKKGRIVELTHLGVTSLSPEIEGAAKRLCPARQTTPNGLLDRVALDQMVEQTALWYEAEFHSSPAAGNCHFTGSISADAALCDSPFTIIISLVGYPNASVLRIRLTRLPILVSRIAVHSNACEVPTSHLASDPQFHTLSLDV